MEIKSNSKRRIRRRRTRRTERRTTGKRTIIIIIMWSGEAMNKIRLMRSSKDLIIIKIFKTAPKGVRNIKQRVLLMKARSDQYGFNEGREGR